jgi:hypothetical protein
MPYSTRNGRLGPVRKDFRCEQHRLLSPGNGGIIELENARRALASTHPASFATAGDLVSALNAKAQERGWTFTCNREPCSEPKLNHVSGLWQERAKNGEIPARSDFSIRDLKSVTPELLIVELVADEDRARFRYRYVGTHVARTMGEMTGKFMDEVLEGTTLERTIACYETVIQAREPLRFLTKFSLNRINYFGGEFLCAPLASDHKVVDMVMAVVQFQSLD